MNIIRVEDAADPRIAGFLNIRERDLTGREGLFVAEGEVVLRTFASPACRCRPVSVLIAENRLEGLVPILSALPGAPPIHVAPQPVLDAIAGFHLHRGILALGAKPPATTLDELLAATDERAILVAACGIGNHDNIGGLFRNAAAFGAAGMILDDRCGDPFYRKSIRVSVGAVMRMPTVTGLNGAEIVTRLQAAGVEVLAFTPGAAVALDQIRPRGRTAILLGSEGPGLPQAIIDRCRPVAIRMAGDFDSLNVAVTSAVALHHLSVARSSITGMSDG